MNKKGCLIYDFENYKPMSTNIGDYVQTLSALNIVKEDYKKLVWINREELGKVPDGVGPEEKVNVIMNGWYSHNQETFPINERINPLFVSVHINNVFQLTDNVISTFKKYQPIGCRDLDSVRKLEEVGVEAYFSGCLTLTLDRKSKKPRKGIVFVIDNIIGIKSFREFIRWHGAQHIIDEILKSHTMDDIKSATFLDQTSSLTMSIKKQFKLAEKRLEILSEAELVIATRIHSLMPSMAMGTKTIAILLNRDDGRFGGLKDYWNYIDYTDYHNDNVLVNINRDGNRKVLNNNDFRELMKPTIKIVKDFWNNK